MLTAVPPAQPGLPAFSKRSAQAARKGLAAARLVREEARRAASSAEARLRASRTVQLECRRLRKRRAETAALAGHGRPPPRAFDATDLGQGRKMAGGPSFQRTRRCLWRRMVELFSTCPTPCARRKSGRGACGVKGASGAWALRGATFYRDEMLKLKHAAEAHDQDALVRFFFTSRPKKYVKCCHHTVKTDPRHLRWRQKEVNM